MDAEDWAGFALFIIFVICAIINTILLVYELRQRSNASVTFVTKWLKYFSIVTIICGVSASLLGVFSVYLSSLPYEFPWLFTYGVANTFGIIQQLSMSFYQLSRLHYCFSNEQIHSFKGYPKWVFIIMYIIGVVLTITWIINWNIEILWSDDCENEAWGEECETGPTFWILFVSVILFVLWDLLILVLYSRKIAFIKKYKSGDIDPKMRQKIMFVLHRITILTLSYYVTGFPLLLSGSTIIQAMPLSFLMLLMMDHNDKLYIKYLKFIKYGTCYCICCCCCCRHMVITQFEMLNENIKNLTDRVDTNTPQSETTHRSIQDHRITETGMELSLETTVIVE